MKKRSRSAVPRVDPYIDGLMAKLLERLVRLEKKIDVVIGAPLRVPAAAPRRDRILYEAICADCHKVCEVPFKPTEERPVYCKECWARRKSGGASSRPGMPLLTPVALSPKPASKLSAAAQAASSAAAAPKKAKKTRPAKKSKKRK